MQWEEKPYHLYMPKGNVTPDREEGWQALLETTVHGHACEIETSVSLANHPHLVKMGRVPKEPATPLGRMADLPPSYSGIWWYGDYPDHYAGDARVSTIAKGQAMVQLLVDSLAEYIAAVKEDEVVPDLPGSFSARPRIQLALSLNSSQTRRRGKPHFTSPSFRSWATKRDT